MPSRTKSGVRSRLQSSLEDSANSAVLRGVNAKAGTRHERGRAPHAGVRSRILQSRGAHNAPYQPRGNRNMHTCQSLRIVAASDAPTVPVLPPAEKRIAKTST